MWLRPCAGQGLPPGTLVQHGGRRLVVQERAFEKRGDDAWIETLGFDRRDKRGNAAAKTVWSLPRDEGLSNTTGSLSC